MKSSTRRSGKSPVADPTTYTPEFSWRQNGLFCEGVRLEEIATQTGTPAYVYSAASITGAYRALDAALEGVPHTICYSVKANGNLSVLRLLASLGSGFDIVSGGELRRLQRAGADARRAVFAGVGKTREEIRGALQAEIRLFNVESEAELNVLSEEAERAGRPAPSAIRVNPDVAAGGHRHIATGHHTHKFGLDWEDARKLYLRHRDSRWIRWEGIGAHIGSQILQLGPFQRALKNLARYFQELKRAGISLQYLDIGGGRGVRYVDEKPLSAAEYGQMAAKVAGPLGCHLLLEPGRSIVAPAGVLLMRVLYTKKNRGKTFVIVDAAMNDFIRPALYEARHPITKTARMSAGARSNARKTAKADIVGPVCETGDCFLEDWPLGEVKAGELLAMWGTGAYGFSQASNYNARPRPAEVLVEGQGFRVIRRRETVDDLMRGE